VGRRDTPDQDRLARRLLFERMKILPLYLGASSILRALGQCAAHNSLAFSTGLRTEIPVRSPKAAQVSQPFEACRISTEPCEV